MSSSGTWLNLCSQMPPKRKAAAKGKGKGAKKTKVEEPEVPATLKDAAAKLKAEDKKKGGKKSHKLDSPCPVFGGTVSLMAFCTSSLSVSSVTYKCVSYLHSWLCLPLQISLFIINVCMFVRIVFLI